MILTGKEIERTLTGVYETKKIEIVPYDKKNVNPNSYNLHLHEDLAVYADHSLDMRRDHDLIQYKIPRDGFVLLPGQLYLGRTVEWTHTKGLVPMLEGRSSVGRLGMFIHVTAGFGDVGFKGFWTLEIAVIQPLRIYAGVAVGQIYYHTVDGEITEYAKDGKYQNNQGIQGSKLWKDFIV